jgi:quercetin dioxygenase-like cupin family protein
VPDRRTICPILDPLWPDEQTSRPSTHSHPSLPDKGGSYPRGVDLAAIWDATIADAGVDRAEVDLRYSDDPLPDDVCSRYLIAIDGRRVEVHVGDAPELRGARVVVPLTEHPKGMHAWKVVIPPERKRPQLESHHGYEGLYILSGELRLLLGGHDLTMKAGEVAEFDTQVPHWFGAAGDQPVEVLSLLSRPGERAHIRAAPRRKNAR